MFAQQKQKGGETTRPKFRRTHPGFYFPGPQFKQGPYGFSMLDPCLLAPRSWTTKDGKPPVRQSNDPGDLRPVSGDKKERRNHVSAPVVSEMVRSTKAHSQRALMLNRNADKTREER